MSLTKRPRPSTFNGQHEVIDLISSDEEPPPKRQRSIPPTVNGVDELPLKNAKPSNATSVASSSQPRFFKQTSSPQTSSIELTVKKSPFKNKPPWRLPAGPETPSLPASKDVPLRDRTSTDENKSRAPSNNHKEDVDRNSFKLKSAVSFRFDPEGRALVDHEIKKVYHKPRRGSFSEKPPPETQNESKTHDAHHRRLEAVEDQKPAQRLLVKVPSISQQPSAPHGSQHQELTINIPLSAPAKLRRARKELLELLKLNLDYAVKNPYEVRDVIGLTGLASSAFPLDLNKTKFANAAQSKKRLVRREQARLDLDLEKFSLTSTSPISNEDASKLIHPRDQSQAILTDRFTEPLSPSLTFANTVNDRALNGKFQFVSEYIFRKGVKTIGTNQPGSTHCTCIGSCGIQCDCLRKMLKEDKSKHDPLQPRSEQVAHYERRSDGLVILRDDFIKRYTIQWNNSKDQGQNPHQQLPERVEISECNENCSCDSSCINRVAQKGRTVPLEIFETNRCGFGVRSSQMLVRGQFIELYLGEVITEAELVQREEAAEAGSTSYVYSLDWFANHKQPCHIDGENFGSAMRFVNHSCSPNAGTFTILYNRSTRQLHHVGFFAIRDIPAGTEITIDYTPQAAGQIYELNDADEGMEKCYCGSSNCRRMLWLPGKERKARKKTIGKQSLD